MSHQNLAYIQSHLQFGKNQISETSRSIKKPIYKHIHDFKTLNNRKALVKHYPETKHSLNFKDSWMFVNIHNKQYRKMAESSIISEYNYIQQGLTF